MTSTDNQPGTELAPIVSESTLARFTQMAIGIPEADDSDAYESIVLQLLAASDVDGLNAPWDTDAAEKLAGYRLRIESITRRPSDYKEGLGIYLVCQGTNMGTGEKFTLTTGSVSVVAQLARAWYLGQFPVICELVIADKLTKNGYRPQHLLISGLGG